jgi:hypothetical protein
MAGAKACKLKNAGLIQRHDTLARLWLGLIGESS